ncbi:MAG TPA: hypothetical protein VFE13_03955 [Caulobacteraceae bacterium]|jgi:uncharacterized membrane protein YphA (DoxX/SURF4 family)|nr:hypothetical protein [Caulobacteraceae bacterium]
MKATRYAEGSVRLPRRLSPWRQLTGGEPTARLRGLIPNLMAAFMAAVFLDSLRYKFTDHPKTQVIFGRLDAWSGSIGLPGLFAHTGLFSQYVIGSIELLASSLLILGLLPRLRHLQAAGALAGLLVMSGAVSFHLFTPLSIDPNNDGGGLFAAACTNLAFAVVLLAGFRRRELADFTRRAAVVFAPASAG